MGRILGIDYGLKRSGLAVTDPLGLIVNSLQAVDTAALMDFLEAYLKSEQVDKIVIGYPTHIDGRRTFLVNEIEQFVETLKKSFDYITIDYHEESFSSQRAKELLITSGVKKKKRREKGIIDKMSAVIILQEYLGHI